MQRGEGAPGGCPCCAKMGRNCGKLFFFLKIPNACGASTRFALSLSHIINQISVFMATIITNENFKELLTGSLPVVIDFNASWCGPCRMVAPIIEELAAEYEGRVVIGKCDVDEEGDVAAECGIRNIPAVFFFKNGELVDKQIGAAPKSKYVEKIEALL